MISVPRPTVLAIFGLGLGAVIVATSRQNPRSLASTRSLRDRAIEAQKIAARAAQDARDLTAQWREVQDSAEERR
jgi:hypothetical protein